MYLFWKGIYDWYWYVWKPEISTTRGPGGTYWQLVTCWKSQLHTSPTVKRRPSHRVMGTAALLSPVRVFLVAQVSNFGSVSKFREGKGVEAKPPRVYQDFVPSVVLDFLHLEPGACFFGGRQFERHCIHTNTQRKQTTDQESKHTELRTWIKGMQNDIMREINGHSTSLTGM